MATTKNTATNSQIWIKVESDKHVYIALDDDMNYNDIVLTREQFANLMVEYMHEVKRAESLKP